ncbi:MAG: cory-CC-star protein [Nesterenkonia sp.]|uniref:cory-CC-star protein n=1 Tax=Nesterenkonia marinintestina TaxID=2979865 RepID=UPI0021C0E5DC|nr:cory-CC-star protein [Nesterenkonia sp. GX14115]MDO5492436.1 cory-CC-star protein [Nesterenkonia sp.]
MAASGLARLRDGLRGLSRGLEEFYVAPYRRTMARARRDEEDLFMMLVLSEALGIPNPASGATLELLPEMLDRMHDWHIRQGMKDLPIEGLSCC